MKAFVTGINGFVGVHLAEHLLATGSEVLGCSRRDVWPNFASPAIRDQVRLLAWDIAQDPSQDLVREVAEFAPTHLVHLAALSVPADCGTDEPSELAKQVNVEGTRRVVELAARLPRKPRLLLAGSCYVYGRPKVRCQVVDEDHPIDARGGYAVSKLAAERIFALTAANENLDWIIARAFHHTGPGQSPRFMLPEWSRQFAGGGSEPIQVHTLDTHLDLSDGRDIVRAYDALLRRGTARTVYNVGSGRCLSGRDVFDFMRKHYDPDRDVVQTSPGPRFHPIADLTRITRDTGWRPNIPIETTIADTMSFWQAEMQR